MFEDFFGGGVALIVTAICIRVMARLYRPTYTAMSKSYEDAGHAESAERLKNLAHSLQTREPRYFYPLIIIGLAMIAISFAERL